jgi:hypothetical protein
MPEIRRQVRQPAFYIHTLFMPAAQPRYDEGVPERMDRRLVAFLSQLDASPVNESAEALPQSFVSEAAAITGHEERGCLKAIAHQLAVPGVDP